MRLGIATLGSGNEDWQSSWEGMNSIGNCDRELQIDL